MGSISLWIALLYFLCMYATCAGFTVQGSNNKQSFYTPGDDVVIPLLITTDNLREHLPGVGNGPATEFTFQILSGSPNWLRVDQPQICTTDECVNGVHWEEKQTYWVELVGSPPTVSQRQTLNGSLQVCHTPTGVCKQVAFTFNLVPSSGSYGLLFRDPAANYGSQLEMRTAIFAPDGVTKTLQSPYFDYYLKPSRVCPSCATYRKPTVSLWYSPYQSTCFRVAKCGDKMLRIRTNVNQSVNVSSATYHEIQLGYWESWSSTLDEKSIDQSQSQLDPSYLYPTANGPVFAQRAAARNQHYNMSMPLFDGNGVLLSGNEPAGAETCVPATLGVDYYSTTTSAICSSNSSPVFQHEQDLVDTIYQGEDYIFVPKLSDPDGQTIQLALQNAPNWLEVGTPANFLSSYLWPHSTDSRMLVRSKYGYVRQTVGPAPGIYTYQLMASDGSGGSATLRRKVLIRPTASHSGATGHRLGALIGDETWFMRGQLDIAAGILNLASSPTTVKAPWLDYYLEWNEGFSVIPKAWYLNTDVTINYVSCGDKKTRLRIQSPNTVTLPANGSIWDSKIGFVYSTSVSFNKADDPSYGSGDFIDPLTAQWVDARRKLNTRVALFSDGGIWEWGETPDWAKNCPDPAIGREIAPRTGWYTQFFDVDTSAEAVEPKLRLDNVDLASKDVGGTMVRTYFKVDGPHTRPYLSTAKDMGNYTVGLNVCGVYNNEYSLLFRLKEGVKLDEYGHLLEDLKARARVTLKRRDKNGQVQIANLSEALDYKNSNRYVASDKIAVYDSDTNLIQGTEVYSDCRSLVSSADTSENMGQWSGVEVMFKDGVPPDYLKQTNIQLGLRNTSTKHFVMNPEDYIRYYFIYNEEDVLDGPQYYDTMKTEVYWGSPAIQIDSCKGNLKSLKYTSRLTRNIAANSSYAGGGLFSNLDLRVSNNTWPRYNKENDYSYLATNTMTPDHRIVIFRGNGEPISGILPEDEEGPVLCPGDKLESGVGYIPCNLQWASTQAGGQILVSDTTGLDWSKSLNIQAFPSVGYRFLKWQTQFGSSILGNSANRESTISQTCGTTLSAVFEKVSDVQTNISEWDSTWQCVENSPARQGLQFVSLWSDGDSIDVLLASRELGTGEYSLYLDGGTGGDSLYGYEKRLRIRPGLSTSLDTFVAGRWISMGGSYLSQAFNSYNESVPGYGVFEPSYLTEIRVKMTWKNALRWWVDGYDQDIGSPTSPMVLAENSTTNAWVNRIDGRTCDWTWTCVSSSSSSSAIVSSSSSASSLVSNKSIDYTAQSVTFATEPLETWMVGRGVWMQIESSSALGSFSLLVDGQAVSIPSSCSSANYCQLQIFKVTSGQVSADIKIEFPSVRTYSVKWWST